MREDYTPRRRRSSAPERKLPLSERLQASFSELKTAIRAGEILLLFFTLFVAASLYTSWTGAGGAAIARFLLSTAGGAVIIPLLLIAWFTGCALFSWKPSSIIRQLCGSFFIFLLLSLLLGLSELTGGKNPAALSAGYFGHYLSAAVFLTTGALGTFITGIILIYFILLSYGVHTGAALALFNFRMPAFFRKKSEKPKAEKLKEAALREEEDYSDDDTASAEEEYDEDDEEEEEEEREREDDDEEGDDEAGDDGVRAGKEDDVETVWKINNILE